MLPGRDRYGVVRTCEIEWLPVPAANGSLSSAAAGALDPRYARYRWFARRATRAGLTARSDAKCGPLLMKFERLSVNDGAEDPTLASGELAGPQPRPQGDSTTPSRDDTASGSSGPSTFVVGSRIGRYIILAKLGEGGMGEVFSAFHEELERRVALKVLHPRLFGDDRGRARMRREAQALARLSHPNVVQAYDVGEFAGRIFMAMEYVKGQTLRVAQARHDPSTPGGRRMILELYVQAGRGLAAAHAAGIIHRDFKPENVMVGDDGRTRVFDFGLAAARWHLGAPGESANGIHPPAPPMDDGLTRTGSILGTPAYMAPEQFLGQSVDHRADIFAFCVALYFALHGEMPFGGETFTDRRAAVLAGTPRDPPPTAAVPPWLRAVLLRGLAREPSTRYSSMDSLLHAIADDPEHRRSQRWRIFRFGVTAVVGALVLAFTGLWGLERWQQGRAEARASARLTAVERSMKEHVAGGAAQDAERVFTAFVTHPDNRDTVALGRAWLSSAERAERADDMVAAIDRFAAAYTMAKSAADQHTALVGLARIFHREMQWPSLTLALDALGGHHEATETSAELAEMRLAATLGRRDLSGATASLRGEMRASPLAAALPILHALQPATMTAQRHNGYAVIADLDGDGRPEIVLDTHARDRQATSIVGATPQLPTVGAVEVGGGAFAALAAPGGRGLLITNDWNAWSPSSPGQPGPEAVLSRVEGSTLVPLFRWPENQIRSALAADVDGDGSVEFLIGTGPYTRRIVELVPAADGSWSTRSPAPQIDRRNSDVMDLLADDLDGDGRVEVVAALGPWNAYELHLLRHDPVSDTLRTVTRRRLGNIKGAALVRGGLPGAGPEIAVSKTDEYPSTLVFPPERPIGEPAGTYLFRFADETLVQTGFVPAPRVAAGQRVIDSPPFIGDLDGDGRDEIILSRLILDGSSSVGREMLVILVRTADRELTPVVLGEVRPIAALDLDGDGDDELIVSMVDGEDPDRVWVLGSGSAELPVAQAQVVDTGEPLRSPDPMIDRMLRHADELERMGLARQSAGNLAAIAELVTDPGLRAQAELRAAERYETIYADGRAAELFARAVTTPATAQRASEGAARTFLRRGRVDAAAAALEASIQGGEHTGLLAAAIAALRERPGDIGFDHPLAASWRIRQAHALRRDGARGALHVDAVVPGEILSAPVHWPGRALVLEVDLDLTEIEYGGGLAIGLLRDGTALSDGESPVGIDITTTGGGTARTHEIGCMRHGHRTVAHIPFVLGVLDDRLGRFTIRATLFPEIDEWTCEVVRGSGEVLLYQRGTGAGPQEAQAMRLGIAGSGDGPALVAADIHMIRLLGASLAAPDDPSDDPVVIAARGRLVEDDSVGVLTALARAVTLAPADRLLEATALARLGRWAEAEHALTRLLADETARPALTPMISAELRTSPRVFGPLLRGAAGAPEYRARFAQAWQYTVRYGRDPAALATVWAGLAELDRDTDDYDVLLAHASAAAGLGHHEAAAASFRAALRALDDPRRYREDRLSAPAATEGIVIHLELASLALRGGDEAAARRELAPLLTGPDIDPAVAERLRARVDLRALWDLAPG